MPRVTININAFGNAQDELLTLDVPLSLTIKDLKAFVEHEAAAQPPAAALHFFLNGRPLTDDVQTLEAAGIKDGEMLAALVRGRDTGPAEREEDREAETARQNTLNDPKSAAALRETVPALAAALDDAARWRDEYKRLKRKEQQAKRERENLMALLNEDPFNVEAQKKIEEIIRQEAVITNLQEAIEETPEVFGRVHMLYVNLEVNGHPVKAFVDSGAQTTVMSPSCAEACGIMRLLDQRFNGIAKGVGTARILGRVHKANIKVGDVELQCSFTVMEGKDVDLLFGLDMLKRYKATIDLDKNALCLKAEQGGVQIPIEVPFLAEHEIPKELADAEVDEPTIAGPGNTEIGGRTGTVRPAAAKPEGTENTPPKSTTQPPAPQQPTSQNGFSAQLENLVGMGFNRQAATRALQIAQGDVDLAIVILSGS